MNEIVKYRNELNKVALRNFKSKELDLFIAIISRMRDKEEEVTFSFDYLKNLIQYETSNSIETFHKELKSMYNKLIKCVYGWETEDEIVLKLHLKITPDFVKEIQSYGSRVEWR